MFEFGPQQEWESAMTSLSAEQRIQIEAKYVVRQYRQGQLVYAHGDPGKSVIIVRRGRLRAYQSDAEGEEVTLCMLSAGHCTGLTSALSGSRRPLAIDAFEASTVCELSRNDLMALMTEIPGFSCNIAVLLASVAQEAVQNSSWFIALTAPQRLARTLLALSSKGAQSSEAGDMVLVEGLCHDQLASMVGVSRTWISLTLRYMQAEGLLRRTRNRIEILDPSRLEHFYRNCHPKDEKRATQTL